MKTKKKKLKTLEDILKLHQNLSGLLGNKESHDPKRNYVSFEVKDNNHLLIQITSLLEVCVFALDGDGMMLPPTIQSSTKEDSVSRVLELVLNILPDSQLYFMDRLAEKLSELGDQ